MEQEPPTSPRSPLAVYPSPPQSRAAEFYGFAAFTGTSVLFILYHLWALLPDEVIRYIGVGWYPSREWAILVPAYSVILILLTYFTYWALALAATPSFDELSTITDSHAHVPRPHEENPYLVQANPDALPEQYDLPLGLVNRVLYRKEAKEE
ncbi:hypothetical protein M422DRAFT_34286 [Sphaerobolus stellatus SS14]|uniref:Unplaced genomic scaffold SPHSTscaffold_104, whole genome shotgun sequence n=1 Tax=Sphaerobolus stellatus (strain SS14) TaxID=990650 RepID=A0A0C9VFZ9_SPHS4|nr:hypothetical protein M422DRAFT_34286 [Sphaerobolus stellatus SS14]